MKTGHSRIAQTQLMAISWITTAMNKFRSVRMAMKKAFAEGAQLQADLDLRRGYRAPYE
jgi:hypothetical protein